MKYHYRGYKSEPVKSAKMPHHLPISTRGILSTAASEAIQEASQKAKQERQAKKLLKQMDKRSANHIGVSYFCKRGRHEDCFKLHCPCKCGHGPVGKSGRRP